LGVEVQSVTFDKSSKYLDLIGHDTIILSSFLISRKVIEIEHPRACLVKLPKTERHESLPSCLILFLNDKKRNCSLMCKAARTKLKWFWSIRILQVYWRLTRALPKSLTWTSLSIEPVIPKAFEVNFTFLAFLKLAFPF